MATTHIGIVGAGTGGLALALRMAHAGHRVTVFERTDQVGGRNRRLTVGDCHFDAGPTLLMMREPFARLFADVGESMDERLPMVPCDPNYRVTFGDGTSIDATTNREAMTQRIRDLAGESDARAYGPFLDRLGAMYDAAIPTFVQRNYDSAWPMVSPRAVGIALRHRMLANLAREVARTFRDARLRELFSLQTMYLGLSPRRAPFLYATLTHMEYGGGIWYPQGGMARLSETLAELAAARGADIRLNAPVRQFGTGRIELESGETVPLDAVVCNADLPYAQRSLRHRPITRRRRYSCSAYMLYIDYKGTIPELTHHSIFIGRDFHGNLAQIFDDAELPTDPAFYTAISGRTDPTVAPPGHENLYILIPCPNLRHPWSETDAHALRERAFARLEAETSFQRSQIAAVKDFTPRNWAEDLNLDFGAAFGLSHDLWQSAGFRPRNLDCDLPGVFYVGASTVPGNGLPMALISAELAAARLREFGTFNSFRNDG